MPFKQFQYLKEVMACRSINRAAQNLYISPQALRSAIGSMEDKVGFKIFERSKQGVSLTPEGEQIEEDIEEIIRISERWNRIRTARSHVDGVVRLVASTSVCNTIIPAVMLECRERYPSLQLLQYEARDDGMLSLLTKKRMIAVAGAVPVPEVQEHYIRFAQEYGYLLETLRRDQYYVYLNNDHPLAARGELELKDLSALTLAIFPNENKRLAYRRVFDYFSPDPPFFLMHQESIFQMVAENRNVACLFPAIAGDRDRYVLGGKICPMRVRDFPMPALACMLHPAPRELTNGEKAVMDLIRAKLQDPAETEEPLPAEGGAG